MKIVVFGPHKRVGALRGELVVDLSLAFAKFLKERQNERHPTLLASALVPSDLARFIDGGSRTLENAQAASTICSATPTISSARTARHWCNRFPRCASMRRVRKARALRAPAAISPTILREWQRWVCCRVREPCRSNRRPPGSGTTASGVSGRSGESPPDRTRKCLIPAGRTASTMKARWRSFSANRARMFPRTKPEAWSGASRCSATGAFVARGSPKARSSSAWRRTSTSPARWGRASWWANSIQRTSMWRPGSTASGASRFNTRDMVFSFWEYIEYLSRDLTLYPGDILSGGTAAGTAANSSPRLPDGQFAPERFLKPGDVVEIGSPHIGTLRARIVPK